MGDKKGMNDGKITSAIYKLLLEPYKSVFLVLYL